jgi:hypothetical protein
MPISRNLFLALVMTATAASAAEPDGKSGPLYDTIIAQDTELFTAFNTCDLATLHDVVSADLQFFHDQGGLDVGRDTFINSVKNNVCGKFTRALEPGSVEVWPVPRYGAIETGVHRFKHPDGSPDGIGKFMILWKQEGGRWVMTQTFSYAHMQAPN